MYITCTGTYSCEHHSWQSFLCQNNGVCVEAGYHCECQIRYGGNYCKDILLDHCARGKGKTTKHVKIEYAFSRII